MHLASVNIALGGNVVLFVLFLAAMIAAALFFYRFTLPPVSPRKKILLSILRALSLCLIAGLLFEPVIRMLWTDTQAPGVAVLVDVSQSMSIRDGWGDRKSILSRILHDDLTGWIPRDAVVQYYPFSGTLQSPSPHLPDSLLLDGQSTDIAKALGGLNDQLIRQNIQSVLLVSDGNSTAGRNPVSAAEELHIPVFALGIGDTTEQKDILIEKVVSNSVTYAGSRMPVNVTVKSSGYSGVSVEVGLQEGSTLLDHKTLKIAGGSNEYPIDLSYEPKEEGTKKITVSVSALPGELTDRNNTRVFFVKVLRSKLHLLVFSGAPNPDLPAVRQALLDDQRFSVKTYTQKSAGRFYEGPVTQPTLDSTDCFVFIGFPSQAARGDILSLLQQQIEKRKVPLFFLNGKSTDYQKLQLFEPVLPFGWSALNPVEMYVFPVIPDEVKDHPLVTLDGTLDAGIWQLLPPIYSSQTTFRSKPEALVIASSRMQTVALNEPLIAARSVAGQKSLAVTGYGIWRWQLTSQDNAQTSQFFHAFLSNAVRWLTTNADERNVRVTPVKDVFTTAEPVQFEGQVFDSQVRPVDNADVIINLRRNDEQFQLPLNPVASGRYEGSLDGLSEGEYTYTANATVGGTSLGQDHGKFSVGQVNAEFLETRMNESLLEQIAYHTGGKFYDIRDMDSLRQDIARDIHFTPKEISRATELELWNWQYIGGCIIALLAAEWFVRRRSGML
ncbi:MAG TPA: hypothetical protein VLY03_05910 [Bacteroidota bacterium]|nr:hypothetical protein [Bacteroidota bacterium]